MPASDKASVFAQKINYHLERLIPITTPAGVALGLFFPSVFIHLRPFVILLFGMMTFSGAIKLTVKEMGNAVKDPVPIIMFFISAHIVMPIIAVITCGFIFTNTEIITGFVLLFAGPTAVSGFIWILIFKGDKALALSFILLDTLLAPLIVPGTLSILLGKSITMDMSGISISLLLMVVLPTILGVSLNEVSKGKVPSVISLYFDPFSKICLILVIAANASAIAYQIRFKDPLVWQTALVCVLLIIAGFSLIYAVTVLLKLNRAKGTSILVAGGLRNNSAVLTIAVSFFSETVALPIIISLVTQQIIMAFVGKLITRKKNKNLSTDYADYAD